MTFSWVIFGLNISLNYSVSTWLLQLGHSNSEDLLPNPEKHCCTLVGLNFSGFLPYYWVVSEILTKPSSLILEEVPFFCFFKFLFCSLQIRHPNNSRQNFTILSTFYIFFMVGTMCS